MQADGFKLKYNKQMTLEEYIERMRKFISFCEYPGHDISTISDTISLDMILYGHNEKGYTSIMLCVIQHNVEMFNLIIQKIKTAPKTKSDLVRISKFLNGRNKHGQTVLHICILFRDTNMLKSLLEIGCNPLTTDWKLKNVYHYIAEQNLIGFTECIHQALMDRKNNREYTSQVKEIERKLLSAKDHEGMTPIHTAIEIHHDINLLIDLLDPDYQEGVIGDRFKDECLMIIMSKSHSTILHQLMEIGDAMLLEYILLRIPQHKQIEFIDQDNGYGNTPLHIGVACNNIGCVELLIQYGANKEKWNAEDLLPIHYCVSEEMMEILLQKTNRTT
ncbi:NF-kappa-B inhibitor delta [Oopsacas minuta]|uniref:NF-kappa-B inhibitor delta n=1 Tax=Oopsacas minuta TaxID=111878 RepID=A0AAV7JKQ8_9METZ|nr:NF-kappa-B inhibitor delta [Oopsacas minuta]